MVVDARDRGAPDADVAILSHEDVHVGSRSDARTAKVSPQFFGGRNMKTMTRMAMMVAVMVLAVTSVGQAQGGGGGRGGNRVMAVLKDSMKVSEAILTKADSIQKAFAEKRQPLMEAARGGDADARGKMAALQTEQTAAIKALLTPEQQAQYDKIMAAFPMGRRGGGTL
jgi:hypothetical protein